MNNLGVSDSSRGTDSSRVNESSLAEDPSVGLRSQEDKASTIDSQDSSKQIDPSHFNNNNRTDPNLSSTRSSGSSGVGNASVASPHLSSSSSSISSSVRPSDGVLHHLKKAFSLSTSHAGEDPLINESYGKLEASKSDLARLRASMNEYETLSRQFTSAFNQVCHDSVRCFQDYQHPYADMAKQMLELQQQQQSVLDSISVAPLVDQLDQLCAALDEDQRQIQKKLDERNTKLSDVQYYLSKVQKLKQETTSNEGESERLDRNIKKYEKIQEEYNRENEQLVNGMNESWKKRCLSLGLILVQFLQKRGAFENQRQFTLFQPQLNTIDDQAKQEQLKKIELKSKSLVPKDAGKIREEPIEQKADETQSRVGNQQTDMDNPRASDSSFTQPKTQHQPSTSQTAADSSSISSRGATEVRPPPLVDLVLWEEQFGYHKETFVRERVHVRKSITTDTVTMTIPIRKETVVFESEPVETDISSSLGSLSLKQKQNEIGEGAGWKKEEEMGREDQIRDSGEITDGGRDVGSERDTGGGIGMNSRRTERGSRVSTGDANRLSSSWDQMKEGRSSEDISRFSEDSSKDRSSFSSSGDVKSDLLRVPHEGQELVMILHEERPRFILDWVPVERLVVKKSREQSVQEISAEVRKEKIELDQSGVHSLPNERLVI